MERTQLLSPTTEKKSPGRPVAVLPVDEPQRPAPPGLEPRGGGERAGHEDEIDLNVPEPRPIWVVAAAVMGISVLGALLVTGLVPRQREGKELRAAAAAAANAPVLVDVTHARLRPEMMEIALPGTLRPWQEVSLFARTTGYLKKFHVDISDQVQAGQLMAEVDTPELNQQLHQAEAALLQGKASVTKALTDRNLAEVTYNRFKKLFEARSTTPQDLDEKKSALDAAEAAVEAARANVAAAEANVQRLTEMQQFEKVVAPFAGVVTGRAYDVGSLILADPTSTDAKPMYKIAENDVLRVFVNVPQSSALRIVKGMEVNVTTRERPGQTFTGKVMGTTNYLDPSNRSLLTEVKVLNAPRPDGTYALLPGMYVQTKFQVKRDAPPLVIPAPALVNNADGTQVALVKNGIVHFQKVELGDDYGSEIEIVGGLTPEDQVITNPGERVVDGASVRTHSDEASQPAPK